MTPTSKISDNFTDLDARLARCLGIRNLQAFEGFVDAVWERSPAIWSAEDFPVRLTLDKVEHLFHEQLFREADVRLVQGGQDILSSARHLDQRGFVRAAQVWALLSGGATLVIKHFDRHHARTGSLCGELESILHQPIIANLYVTPQSRQGLPLHQDYHDVLVCQLDGEKRWEIHECRELPGETAPSFPGNEADAGPVVIRHTLVPGEVMYAPRGSHHRAIAGLGGSVHVTLGVHAKKWGDLLIETLKHLLETDEDFRRSLPIGFLDPHWRAQAAPAWTRLLDTLRAADPQPALDDLRRRLLKWRGAVPAAPQPERAGDGSPWLIAAGPQSTLVRIGLAHCDAGGVDGASLFHLPGFVLNIAPDDGAFARWLASRTRFRVDEIPFEASAPRAEILRQCLRAGIYRSCSAAE